MSEKSKVEVFTERLTHINRYLANPTDENWSQLESYVAASLRTQLDEAQTRLELQTTELGVLRKMLPIPKNVEEFVKRRTINEIIGGYHSLIQARNQHKQRAETAEADNRKLREALRMQAIDRMTTIEGCLEDAPPTDKMIEARVEHWILEAEAVLSAETSHQNDPYDKLKVVTVQ